ncbi:MULTISPECIES: magnesium and cobalt transport protein CorA [Microbacterium]|jgi:magnesium transporter|uniref:magnesium and cobalt transport protein CorA n=1 Tax=Microbacterium TaxID=33882 RepID=UPI001E58D8DA|nr:magnesium and cobalt transport protein CorA [Microbacterium nymphoidis]MCD2499867.1 magnesium and cobalt transport protein CorA [Microbacterium nymphoidis]
MSIRNDQPRVNRLDPHRLIPARRPIPPAPPAGSRGTRTVHLFRDGSRIPGDESATLAEAVAYADGESNHLAVIGYDLPTPDQIAELAEQFDLHPILVEDLENAGQRPKVERYGDVLFVVVRSALYRDWTEEVEFAEFHLIVRGNTVAVICQDREKEQKWDLEQFGGDPELLALGSEAVVYTVLDTIVDGYASALDGLDVDKEQIERQVFTGERSVTERIYRLSREVIDLQHAASPMGLVLVRLRAGFGKYRVAEELQTHLQDVGDHLSRATTRTTDLRDALNQILSVNSTLVTQRQNEDMKKISGWAAILFAPTLIGAIYGMNFDNMPELHWDFGYPLAVGAMLLLGVGLWLVFRRKDWM